MRIFVIIAAFNVLSLGVAPCFHSIENSKLGALHTAKHHNQHSSEGCSPFCYCMCHGAVIICETNCTVPDVKQKIVSIVNCITTDLYSETYIDAIWQPPMR